MSNRRKLRRHLPSTSTKKVMSAERLQRRSQLEERTAAIEIAATFQEAGRHFRVRGYCKFTGKEILIFLRDIRENVKGSKKRLTWMSRTMNVLRTCRPISADIEKATRDLVWLSRRIVMT